MKQKLTHEEISSFSLELSLLLHAGVTVGGALALLADESGPDYHDLLDPMAQAVDDGASLSQALRQSGAFPVYVCGLVEVGERSGRTEEALRALSEYQEGRSRMGRKLRSALLYPAVMLVLMLVIIGVLLVKVLPIFDDVYASLGSQLTGVAGGLLLVGRWLDRAMPVLWAVLAVLAVFFFGFAAVGGFRAKVLSLWRGRRGDKGVSRKMNTARLVQALSMGMSSGLPLEEAVELAQELDLPSAPKQFLRYFEEPDRPQAKLDRDLEGGMAITLGRLRPDTQYDYKFVGLSHNTLRGAAGGAVLLAELLCAENYITRQ